MLRFRLNLKAPRAYLGCSNTLQETLALFSRSEAGARRQKSVRRGFTLIELLVTVAVIAVFMSLLIPALSSAKRKAHSARCISNLHQLGITIRLYADEKARRLRTISRWHRKPYTATSGVVARSSGLPAVRKSRSGYFGERDSSGPQHFLSARGQLYLPVFHQSPASHPERK